MKKKIGFFGTIVLILFSFYYTNNIIKISRNNDPIMIEIMNYNNEYIDSKIEAIIQDNNIIPGKNGKKINIKDSYYNMKKIGNFDKKLLAFETTYPEEKLNENYEKYIIGGNKNNSNISIIYLINDFTNIYEILTILKQKNINIDFFISEEIFDSNVEIIKKIIDLGNNIELYSNSYSNHTINKKNELLRLLSKDKLEYCINYNKDKKKLINCSKSKLHTILPNIIIDNYLYKNIKEKLNNGSIILLKNKKTIIKELPSTIDYIKQKGKKIVLLKNLLEE